ncbi:MAG: TA system VapC family ribonuclease toxin [Terracidiphilus sp.]|jgi:toxin-antitoxin system PIN domain toxin
MVRASLLDVNALIALVWSGHPHHQACRNWFEQNHSQGWATCAISEAGFVRVVSSPAFAARHATVHEAIEMLKRLKASVSGHSFWNDDLSIEELADHWQPPLGNKQVTDAYLLSLAMENKGTLVTFDQAISSLAGRANLASATLLVLNA